MKGIDHLTILLKIILMQVLLAKTGPDMQKLKSLKNLLRYTLIAIRRKKAEAHLLIFAQI